VVAPIVDLTDASGKIGPWPIKITTTQRIARAIVSFDASGATPAQAVVNVWDGNLSSIEVTIPRTPFGLLGVEPAVFGLEKASSFFVEGDAEYTARSAARVDGHVHVSASGVRAFGSTTPSQLDVELHFGGDPRAAVDWGEGAIALGSARARPTGAVTLGAGFIVADLLWKAGGGRCPGGGDASIGSAFHVDSRNLDA
jgi:hypothetical protein